MAPAAELEALKVLFGLLWKNVDRALVSAETVQTLLERHGVVSRAEYETLYRELERTNHVRMLKMWSAALKDFDAAATRRLLEQIDGEPQ